MRNVILGVIVGAVLLAPFVVIVRATMKPPCVEPIPTPYVQCLVAADDLCDERMGRAANLASYTDCVRLLCVGLETEHVCKGAR